MVREDRGWPNRTERTCAPSAGDEEASTDLLDVLPRARTPVGTVARPVVAPLGARPTTAVTVGAAVAPRASLGPLPSRPVHEPHHSNL